MSGELIAVASAFFYGLGGVAIAKGRSSAVGDNGVFLSVLMTAGCSFLLWLGWGTARLGAVLDTDALPALGYFALAGVASIVIARTAMYRATALIGAVMASLLRRLIPVFTIPLAFVLLHQIPQARVIWGGAIILAGVIVYAPPRWGQGAGLTRAGMVLGTVSALFYAVSYSLRARGLVEIPDPALGTFIGAAVGVIWLVVSARVRRGSAEALRYLWVDRGPWHCCAAAALSLGQMLQFFALTTAPVSTVAILGTLEVLFAAILGAWVFRSEELSLGRFVSAAGLMIVGTIFICL